MLDKPILLVEDNQDDEALAIRALKKHEIDEQVLVARDGAEALDMLLPNDEGQADDTPVQPALILLDLNIPKISGIDVLMKLKSDHRTRRIPIVVMTTSNADTDVNRCYDEGANSYIHKPVDFRKFVETLGHVGRYWLQVNHAAVSA